MKDDSAIEYRDTRQVVKQKVESNHCLYEVKFLVAGAHRSCLKFPPCPTKPMPDGSKMDLPVAKAKPISKTGSASGITDLRKGSKLPRWGNCSQKSEEWEYVRETAVQTPTSVGKEGVEIV